MNNCKIKKIYNYINEHGNIVSQTVRFEPKKFLQRRPYNNGYAWGLKEGWYEYQNNTNNLKRIKNCMHDKSKIPHLRAIWLDEAKTVLYRLPELLQAIKREETIYISEGEKDVDNFFKLGLVATTCPMGAGKWKDSYTKSLENAKQAVIIPDKDIEHEVGLKHAEFVANELNKIGIKIKLLILPDINNKHIKDISDWLEAGGTKEVLLELVEQCLLWQIKDAKEEKIENKSTSNNELIRRYGEPYYINEAGKISSINELFWAGLYYSRNIELYEPDEKVFYKYDQKTGLYFVSSEDVIKQEISSDILSYSRQNKSLRELERKRTNCKLNNIVEQLKGISEKRDIFKNKTQRLVHLNNGIVLFKKNTADFVEFSPFFYSRNQSPINFDVTAKCPRFLEELLLPAVSSEDAILIQKYAGMCLLGDNLAQRLFILDGLGGRGKTQLALIIQHLVGLNNVTQLRTQHLCERFELYRFLKKTLLVGVDVQSDFLMTKGAFVLKGLVGGDLLDAEQKGENGNFQLFGNFCVLIVSNSRLCLRLEGDISAWKRRLLIVRFEAPPPKKKIPNFSELLIREEGSGILNWALQGLELLLSDIDKYGDINLTKTQNEIVDSLLAESDSLRHFLYDQIESTNTGDLTINEIIEAYAEYCPQKKWNAKPITALHRELEALMLELFGTTKSHSIKREGKNLRGFRRVKFKDSSED